MAMTMERRTPVPRAPVSVYMTRDRDRAGRPVYIWQQGTNLRAGVVQPDGREHVWVKGEYPGARAHRLRIGVSRVPECSCESRRMYCWHRDLVTEWLLDCATRPRCTDCGSFDLHLAGWCRICFARHHVSAARHFAWDGRS